MGTWPAGIAGRPHRGEGAEPLVRIRLVAPTLALLVALTALHSTLAVGPGVGPDGADPLSRPIRVLVPSERSRTPGSESAGSGRIQFDPVRALPRSYAGKRTLIRALESRNGRGRLLPLSLASGDFDRDGVDDLVVGYGAGSAGILVLYRGNVDSIYPNTPEARARREGGADRTHLSSGLVTRSARRSVPTFSSRGTSMPTAPSTSS